MLFAMALMHPASALDISACGSYGGVPLNLTQDISSNASCLNIGASNTTLEGNNHTIYYSGNTSGNAITISAKNNISINHLYINHSNISTGVSFKGSIYIYTRSYNVSLNNINIVVHGNNLGVYELDSYNVSIFNISILAETFSGIQLNNVTNSSISLLNSTSSSGYGGQIIKSLNNTINNSNFTSSSNNGIIIDNSSYNILQNNSFNSNTNYGVYLRYVLAINNSFINNNFTSITNYPIFREPETYGRNYFNNNTLCCISYYSSPKPNLIYVIGDSITYGTNGVNYLPTLMTNLNSYYGYSWNYINGGIGGQTTEFMKLRLLEDIQLYNPNRVMILGGINDIAGTATNAQAESNLTWMAQQIVSLGLPVYVLSLTPQSSVDSRVRQVDSNLSTNLSLLNIPFVNIYDSIDTGMGNGTNDAYNASNMFDGVHPNATGATAIGNAIMTVFYNISSVGSYNIDHNGQVYWVINSTKPSLSQAVNISLLPTADSVNITIINYTVNGEQIINVSSATHNNPTLFIWGDKPPNTLINVKKNGVNWNKFTSNSTGYITFNYTDGYSDIQFDAVLDSSSIPGTIPHFQNTFYSGVDIIYGFLAVIVVAYLGFIAVSFVLSIVNHTPIDFSIIMTASAAVGIFVAVFMIALFIVNVTAGLP